MRRGQADHDAERNREYHHDAEDALAAHAEVNDMTVDELREDPELVLEALKEAGLLHEHYDHKAFMFWATDEVVETLDRLNREAAKTTSYDRTVRRMESGHAQ